jgi:CRP-like cAMP-binding protein
MRSATGEAKPERGFVQLLGSEGLAPFDESMRRTILTHGRRLHPKENLVVEYESSDCVILIMSGWLYLYKSLQDGRKHIIDFVLPGDIVDPVSADGKSSSLQIEALSEATVSLLPRATWHGMKRDRPALHRLAERIAAAARARLAERTLRLGKGGASMRLAYALLELCVRLRAIGASARGGFHAPLTQQDLGDFTGLSSVHVCRTLRRLEKAGVVSVAGHMDVRILDVAALAAVADIDPEALEREITPSAP